MGCNCKKSTTIKRVNSTSNVRRGILRNSPLNKRLVTRKTIKKLR